MLSTFYFYISASAFLPAPKNLTHPPYHPACSTPHLRPGRLALQDGSVFSGAAFGRLPRRNLAVPAEVVFNTAMCGYQEALTDPSYTGQILLMTYPHMGNLRHQHRRR